jgi:hypothetical protein
MIRSLVRFWQRAFFFAVLPACSIQLDSLPVVRIGGVHQRISFGQTVTWKIWNPALAHFLLSTDAREIQIHNSVWTWVRLPPGITTNRALTDVDSFSLTRSYQARRNRACEHKFPLTHVQLLDHTKYLVFDISCQQHNVARLMQHTRKLRKTILGFK